MRKWTSLFIIIIFIQSNCEALKCYVCKTKEISDCFDISDSTIRSQECQGKLRWNEKFACLMNSSMQNNLIETDRSCLIIERTFDPCEGKVSSSRFGTCKFCFEDECNKENFNGSNKSKSVKIILILCGVLMNILKFN